MASGLNEEAVTAVVSTILIILMVLALGAIVFALVYGIPGGLTKTAYIAVESNVESMNGSDYITLHHKNGDTVALNGSGAERSPKIDVRITHAGGEQIRAEPDGPIVWGAGQTLYIYTTSTGPVITTNRTSAMTSLGFGGRSIDLIIVDTDADVLVFGKTIAGGGWIPDPSEVPVANFTANTTSGYPPLTVQFIDQSTGLPTAWSWSFGDGNISALQNPMHTFSSPGSFTVTLTASNPNGSSIKTKENFIIVINPVDPLPVANFVANATEGEIPLIIQFTDTSTGTPDAWDWDFGDGTTSVEQHPIHTYTTAGYYNVTLTVANAAGNDSITKTNFIHAKGFVDFVIDENVFVYGNVLSFSGNSVTGPGATVVITGGFTTADINQGAAVAVSTIYFDGDVNLLSGSAGLGSSTQPGNIYVNGNMNLNGGSRNIYGDVYVKGDASIRGVILHGTFYIDGNLILGETGVNDFIFSENTRLYYTGTLVHHFNEPYPPEVQYILDRCIQDSSVPGFDMPDQDIPSTKSADWYAARGYVSESPLISNMKIYAPSYTGAVSWWPNPPPYENVIIIAHSGDITITGDDNVIKGVFFAPNGRVTFNGAILEGVVIARDGFYVTSGGTQVTFKNLDQYIGDPNDYPF